MMKLLVLSLLGLSHVSWVMAQSSDVCSNPSTSVLYGAAQCNQLTQLEGCRLGIVNVLFAAANGDVAALRKYRDSGINLSLADYDGRTALHLAAAEGRLSTVQFLLLEAKVPSKPIDRWGNLPLTEAERFGRVSVAEFLRNYYAGNVISVGWNNKRRGGQRWGGRH